jgi:hypothetical protein
MDFTSPVAFNGLSINTTFRGSGGTSTSGYRVLRFNPSRIEVAQFLDKRAFDDGVDASDIYLGARHTRLIVSVIGSTRGDFYDRLQDLLAAFAPRVEYTADTANLGFLPLTFSQPTADLASWTTGLIPLQLYVRSLAPPSYDLERDAVGGKTGKGAALPVTIDLIGRDPRKYAQTATVHTITTSSTTATNLGDYPTPATITIALASTTGAIGFTIGSSAFTVTADSPGSTYVVDSATGTLKRDGTVMMHLITPGVSWPIVLPPGGTAVVRGSLSGASVTMTYRHAFA